MFELVPGLRKHLQNQMFFNQAIKKSEYLIGDRADNKIAPLSIHNSGINNKYNMILEMLHF